MRSYGSTMLSTRAGKFSISSESNGLVTQLELEMGRNGVFGAHGALVPKFYTLETKDTWRRDQDLYRPRMPIDEYCELEVLEVDGDVVVEFHGDEGGGESWRSLRLEILKRAKAILSLIPGQLTYPFASLTVDSARSYVMQGAPFTKRSISSIPIGGSISPEGFLPSILLMEFMVTLVIVAVILVVVVVVIFGVVIVVDGVSSIIKLSFMIIGFLRIIVFYYLLHQTLGYVNGFL
ncbi:hypothetical protein Tco_0919128 [Tanacetum coccineum]